jgi:16S rRNA (cytidine1402-2'-O)-methyltransferase
MATLYLVSTPIGNLGDLSRRAGETLGSVGRVLAEDTRRTRTLMSHLGLTTPLVSLHEHNEAAREEKILGWLAAGEDLALVSDAGTPLVSDPGRRIVTAVVEAGHAVVPIPGPSAVLAALVGSGLPPVPFTFLGFAPRKGKERTAFLERVAASPDTTVLFESPERLKSLLAALVEACGGEREAAVAREVTKLHEEFVRGSLDELAEAFQALPPRGEITVVMAGAPEAEEAGEDLEAAATSLARELLEEGMTPSRVAKELAGELGIPRNRAYRLAQEMNSSGGSRE